MNKKIILPIILAFCGAAVLVLAVIISQKFQGGVQIAIIAAGAAISAVLICRAFALDYSANAYECPKCGEKFVPTLGAYMCGAHTVTARHLKCPKCGKRSMCKRVDME